MFNQCIDKKFPNPILRLKHHIYTNSPIEKSKIDNLSTHRLSTTSVQEYPTKIPPFRCYFTSHSHSAVLGNVRREFSADAGSGESIVLWAVGVHHRRVLLLLNLAPLRLAVRQVLVQLRFVVRAERQTRLRM